MTELTYSKTVGCPRMAAVFGRSNYTATSFMECVILVAETTLVRDVVHAAVYYVG